MRYYIIYSLFCTVMYLVRGSDVSKDPITKNHSKTKRSSQLTSTRFKSIPAYEESPDNENTLVHPWYPNADAKQLKMAESLDNDYQPNLDPSVGMAKMKRDYQLYPLEKELYVLRDSDTEDRQPVSRDTKNRQSDSMSPTSAILGFKAHLHHDVRDIGKSFVHKPIKKDRLSTSIDLENEEYQNSLQLLDSDPDDQRPEINRIPRPRYLESDNDRLIERVPNLARRQYTDLGYDENYVDKDQDKLERYQLGLNRRPLDQYDKSLRRYLNNDDRVDHLDYLDKYSRAIDRLGRDSLLLDNDLLVGNPRTVNGNGSPLEEGPKDGEVKTKSLAMAIEPLNGQLQQLVESVQQINEQLKEQEKRETKDKESRKKRQVPKDDDCDEDYLNHEVVETSLHPIEQSVTCTCYRLEDTTVPSIPTQPTEGQLDAILGGINTMLPLTTDILPSSTPTPCPPIGELESDKVEVEQVTEPNGKANCPYRFLRTNSIKLLEMLLPAEVIQNITANGIVIKVPTRKQRLVTLEVGDKDRVRGTSSLKRKKNRIRNIDNSRLSIRLRLPGVERVDAKNLNVKRKADEEKRNIDKELLNAYLEMLDNEEEGEQMKEYDEETGRIKRKRSIASKVRPPKVVKTSELSGNKRKTAGAKGKESKAKKVQRKGIKVGRRLMSVEDDKDEDKTEKVEKKTEKDDKKTEKVEKKTEKAEKKTEKVEKKTEKVEKKTEKAEKKTEKAEKKTEKAEKKTEKVEKKTEKVEKKNQIPQGLASLKVKEVTIPDPFELLREYEAKQKNKTDKGKVSAAKGRAEVAKIPGPHEMAQLAKEQKEKNGKASTQWTTVTIPDPFELLKELEVKEKSKPKAKSKSKDVKSIFGNVKISSPFAIAKAVKERNELLKASTKKPKRSLRYKRFGKNDGTDYLLDLTQSGDVNLGDFNLPGIPAVSSFIEEPSTESYLEYTLPEIESVNKDSEVGSFDSADLYPDSSTQMFIPSIPLDMPMASMSTIYSNAQLSPDTRKPRLKSALLKHEAIDTEKIDEIREVTESSPEVLKTNPAVLETETSILLELEIGLMTAAMTTPTPVNTTSTTEAIILTTSTETTTTVPSSSTETSPSTLVTNGTSPLTTQTSTSSSTEVSGTNDTFIESTQSVNDTLEFILCMSATESSTTETSTVVTTESTTLNGTSTTELSTEINQTSTAELLTMNSTSTTELSSTLKSTPTTELSTEINQTSTTELSTAMNSTSTTELSTAMNSTSTTELSTAMNSTSTTELSTAMNSTSTTELSTAMNSTSTTESSTAMNTTSTTISTTSTASSTTSTTMSTTSTALNLTESTTVNTTMELNSNATTVESTTMPETNDTEDFIMCMSKSESTEVTTETTESTGLTSTTESVNSTTETTVTSTEATTKNKCGLTKEEFMRQRDQLEAIIKDLVNKEHKLEEEEDNALKLMRTWQEQKERCGFFWDILFPRPPRPTKRPPRPTKRPTKRPTTRPPTTLRTTTTSTTVSPTTETFLTSGSTEMNTMESQSTTEAVNVTETLFSSTGVEITNVTESETTLSTSEEALNTTETSENGTNATTPVSSTGKTTVTETTSPSTTEEVTNVTESVTMQSTTVNATSSTYESKSSPETTEEVLNTTLTSTTSFTTESSAEMTSTTSNTTEETSSTIPCIDFEESTLPLSTSEESTTAMPSTSAESAASASVSSNSTVTETSTTAETTNVTESSSLPPAESSPVTTSTEKETGTTEIPSTSSTEEPSTITETFLLSTTTNGSTASVEESQNLTETTEKITTETSLVSNTESEQNATESVSWSTLSWISNITESIWSSLSTEIFSSTSTTPLIETLGWLTTPTPLIETLGWLTTPTLPVTENATESTFSTEEGVTQTESHATVTSSIVTENITSALTENVTLATTESSNLSSTSVANETPSSTMETVSVTEATEVSKISTQSTGTSESSPELSTSSTSVVTSSPKTEATKVSEESNQTATTVTEIATSSMSSVTSSLGLEMSKASEVSTQTATITSESSTEVSTSSSSVITSSLTPETTVASEETTQTATTEGIVSSMSSVTSSPGLNTTQVPEESTQTTTGASESSTGVSTSSSRVITSSSTSESTGISGETTQTATSVTEGIVSSMSSVTSSPGLNTTEVPEVSTQTTTGASESSSEVSTSSTSVVSSSSKTEATEVSETSNQTATTISEVSSSLMSSVTSSPGPETSKASEVSTQTTSGAPKSSTEMSSSSTSVVTSSSKLESTEVSEESTQSATMVNEVSSSLMSSATSSPGLATSETSQVSTQTATSASESPSKVSTSSSSVVTSSSESGATHVSEESTQTATKVTEVSQGSTSILTSSPKPETTVISPSTPESTATSIVTSTLAESLKTSTGTQEATFKVSTEALPEVVESTTSIKMSSSSVSSELTSKTTLLITTESISSSATTQGLTETSSIGSTEKESSVTFEPSTKNPLVKTTQPSVAASSSSTENEATSSSLSVSSTKVTTESVTSTEASSGTTLSTLQTTEKTESSSLLPTSSQTSSESTMTSMNGTEISSSEIVTSQSTVSTSSEASSATQSKTEITLTTKTTQSETSTATELTTAEASTAEAPTTTRPTTSEASTTIGPTTAEVLTTIGLTTTEGSTAAETTTAESSATTGPTIAETSTTTGPTTAEASTTGSTAAESSVTTGPTIAETSTTAKSTTAEASTTGSTAAEVSTTIRPTTAESSVTTGPTIAETSTTTGPTTAEASTTGSTAAESSVTTGPTIAETSTTTGSTAAEVSTTIRPTTAESSATTGPTIAETSTTTGPTTAEASTTGPTTAESSVTTGTTIAETSTTTGPTTAEASTTGSTAAESSVTTGPTIAETSTTTGPTAAKVSTTIGPTTAEVLTTIGLTTTEGSTAPETATNESSATTEPTIVEASTTTGPTTAKSSTTAESTSAKTTAQTTESIIKTTESSTREQTTESTTSITKTEQKETSSSTIKTTKPSTTTKTTEAPIITTTAEATQTSESSTTIGTTQPSTKEEIVESTATAEETKTTELTATKATDKTTVKTPGTILWIPSSIIVTNVPMDFGNSKAEESTSSASVKSTESPIVTPTTEAAERTKPSAVTTTEASEESTSTITEVEIKESSTSSTFEATKPSEEPSVVEKTTEPGTEKTSTLSATGTTELLTTKTEPTSTKTTQSTATETTNEITGSPTITETTKLSHKPSTLEETTESASTTSEKTEKTKTSSPSSTTEITEASSHSSTLPKVTTELSSTIASVASPITTQSSTVEETTTNPTTSTMESVTSTTVSVTHLKQSSSTTASVSESTTTKHSTSTVAQNTSEATELTSSSTEKSEETVTASETPTGKLTTTESTSPTVLSTEISTVSSTPQTSMSTSSSTLAATTSTTETSKIETTLLTTEELNSVSTEETKPTTELSKTTVAEEIKTSTSTESTKSTTLSSKSTEPISATEITSTEKSTTSRTTILEEIVTSTSEEMKTKPPLTSELISSTLPTTEKLTTINASSTSTYSATSTPSAVTTISTKTSDEILPMTGILESSTKPNNETEDILEQKLEELEKEVSEREEEVGELEQLLENQEEEFEEKTQELENLIKASTESETKYTLSDIDYTDDFSTSTEFSGPDIEEETETTQMGSPLEAASDSSEIQNSVNRFVYDPDEEVWHEKPDIVDPAYNQTSMEYEDCTSTTLDSNAYDSTESPVFARVERKLLAVTSPSFTEDESEHSDVEDEPIKLTAPSFVLKENEWVDQDNTQSEAVSPLDFRGYTRVYQRWHKVPLKMLTPRDHVTQQEYQQMNVTISDLEHSTTDKLETGSTGRTVDDETKTDRPRRKRNDDYYGDCDDDDDDNDNDDEDDNQSEEIISERAKKSRNHDSNIRLKKAEIAMLENENEELIKKENMLKQIEEALQISKHELRRVKSSILHNKLLKRPKRDLDLNKTSNPSTTSETPRTSCTCGISGTPTSVPLSTGTDKTETTPYSNGTEKNYVTRKSSYTVHVIDLEYDDELEGHRIKLVTPSKEDWVVDEGLEEETTTPRTTESTTETTEESTATMTTCPPCGQTGSVPWPTEASDSYHIGGTQSWRKEVADPCNIDVPVKKIIKPKFQHRNDRFADAFQSSLEHQLERSILLGKRSWSFDFDSDGSKDRDLIKKTIKELNIPLLTTDASSIDANLDTESRVSFNDDLKKCLEASKSYHSSGKLDYKSNANDTLFIWKLGNPKIKKSQELISPAEFYCIYKYGLSQKALDNSVPRRHLLAVKNHGQRKVKAPRSAHHQSSNKTSKSQTSKRGNKPMLEKSMGKVKKGSSHLKSNKRSIFDNIKQVFNHILGNDPTTPAPVRVVKKSFRTKEYKIPYKTYDRKHKSKHLKNKLLFHKPVTKKHRGQKKKKPGVKHRKYWIPIDKKRGIKSREVRQLSLKELAHKMKDIKKVHASVPSGKDSGKLGVTEKIVIYVTRIKNTHNDSKLSPNSKRSRKSTFDDFNFEDLYRDKNLNRLISYFADKVVKSVEGSSRSLSELDPRLRVKVVRGAPVSKDGSFGSSSDSNSEFTIDLSDMNTDFDAEKYLKRSNKNSLTSRLIGKSERKMNLGNHFAKKRKNWINEIKRDDIVQRLRKKLLTELENRMESDKGDKEGKKDDEFDGVNSDGSVGRIDKLGEKIKIMYGMHHKSNQHMKPYRRKRDSADSLLEGVNFNNEYDKKLMKALVDQIFDVQRGVNTTLQIIRRRLASSPSESFNRSQNPVNSQSLRDRRLAKKEDKNVTKIVKKKTSKPKKKVSKKSSGSNKKLKSSYDEGHIDELGNDIKLILKQEDNGKRKKRNLEIGFKKRKILSVESYDYEEEIYPGSTEEVDKDAEVEMKFEKNKPEEAEKKQSKRSNIFRRKFKGKNKKFRSVKRKVKEMRKCKNCICDIEKVIQDLKNMAVDRLNLLDRVASYECKKFVNVGKEIVLTPSRVLEEIYPARSDLAQAKGLKYIQLRDLENVLQAGEVVGRDHEILSFPGMDLVIPCNREGAEFNWMISISRPNYTWARQDDTPVSGIIHKNGNLELSGLSIQDAGNYSCTLTYIDPDNEEVVKHVYKHGVQVVTLPRYSLRGGNRYRTENCEDEALDTLATYLPQKLNTILCPHKLCDTFIFAPRCYDHEISIKVLLTLSSLTKAVSVGSKCGLRCHKAIQDKIILLLSKNLGVILTKNIVFRLSHGRRQTLVPDSNPRFQRKKDYVGDDKNNEIFERSTGVGLLVGCPAGYGLNTIHCVPCLPGFHSKDLSPQCKRCPVGSYQPNLGSRVCRLCSNPFIDGCYEMLWTSPITLGSFSLIIIILSIGLILCITISCVRKERDRNKCVIINARNESRRPLINSRGNSTDEDRVWKRKKSGNYKIHEKNERPLVYGVDVIPGRKNNKIDGIEKNKTPVSCTDSCHSNSADCPECKKLNMQNHCFKKVPRPPVPYPDFDR